MMSREVVFRPAFYKYLKYRCGFVLKYKKYKHTKDKLLLDVV